MSWFSRLLSSIKTGINKYNANAFYQLGQMGVPFDFDNSWAIETAYAKNPDVYSIVNQMSNKSASVPFYIKKVKDEKALRQYYNKRQFISKDALISKNKAFDNNYLPLPLEQPNVLYGWKHFIQLCSTYLNTTGNIFIYKYLNEIGEVQGLYVLPSNLIKIYLKKDTTTLESESPILGYELIYKTGANLPFSSDEVIHIKLPNPEWGLNGENLYGFSPLKSAYYNVENVIQANKHLYKMFKSSGAFGFIFAKGETLDPKQAEQFADRIKEMDKSSERLARISGISTEIGFQRVALGNKELMPWDSLKYDRKTICNVLGWRDELLNNDKGSSLGGGNEAMEARKSVLLDTIMPQLQLLEESLNQVFITFKGYEKTKFVFDVTEMPEVQQDVSKIVEWANKAPLTTNEFRALMNYEAIEDDLHNKVLIPTGKMTLDEIEARGLNMNLFEDGSSGA